MPCATAPQARFTRDRTRMTHAVMAPIVHRRRLFSMNLTTASWGEHVGMDEMYRNFGAIAVDPRQMAQRVMDIR